MLWRNNGDKMKAKLPAILAAVTTLIGLLSSPMVLGLIPAEYAAVVIALGGLWQAVTKAVTHKE
jgi:hypothetical protein